MGFWNNALSSCKLAVKDAKISVAKNEPTNLNGELGENMISTIHETTIHKRIKNQDSIEVASESEKHPF